MFYNLFIYFINLKKLLNYHIILLFPDIFDLTILFILYHNYCRRRKKKQNLFATQGCINEIYSTLEKNKPE